MTVKEMIEELEKLDQNLPVCQRVSDGEDHDFFSTLSIRELELVFEDDEKLAPEKYDADGERLPITCVALEYM